MKLEKDELIIKIGLTFYITSFLGYLYELIINYYYSGKIFSHGILNGPWLPIYGAGAILIMSMYKYRKNPFLVFILSFLLSGILEYICGFILLKFFKMRLWDYTRHFLNINGFICFLSVFCFGIGGLIITYLLYPFVKRIYKKVDKKILKYLLSILSIIFIGDIIATILK